MGKNIVACCDGTGNQIEQNLSNVLKLFRICQKNQEQRVYYSAGIGTIGSSDAWSRLKQNTKSIFGLATGNGLDTEILGAYEFICRYYDHGDDIFLFGFSRGAYTARAVAGMIHMIGLLPPDQLNIVDYALRSYKRASENDDFSIAWHFSKVAGGRSARIKFLGAWDTVASVLIPRKDRAIPQFLTLPYTRRNPSVEIFRHAMAIDERRRMFRLNYWTEPQSFVQNPFSRPAQTVQQNIKQVWFAGAHADIGGGYPEEESGLSKFSLDWLVREAVASGLKINAALRNHTVLGRPRAGAKTTFVKPNPVANAHDSLTWGWRPLEWIPKSAKWREWRRLEFAGLYFPNGEPRIIEEPRIIDNIPVQAYIHQSVIDRMNALARYRPVNLPAAFAIEPH